MVMTGMPAASAFLITGSRAFLSSGSTRIASTFWLMKFSMMADLLLQAALGALPGRLDAVVHGRGVARLLHPHEERVLQVDGGEAEHRLGGGCDAGAGPGPREGPARQHDALIIVSCLSSGEASTLRLGLLSGGHGLRAPRSGGEAVRYPRRRPGRRPRSPSRRHHRPRLQRRDRGGAAEVGGEAELEPQPPRCPPPCRGPRSAPPRRRLRRTMLEDARDRCGRRPWSARAVVTASRVTTSPASRLARRVGEPDRLDADDPRLRLQRADRRGHAGDQAAAADRDQEQRRGTRQVSDDLQRHRALPGHHRGIGEGVEIDGAASPRRRRGRRSWISSQTEPSDPDLRAPSRPACSSFGGARCRAGRRCVGTPARCRRARPRGRDCRPRP